MDRRDFISTAGTLVLTGAAIELRAASQSFDPTEQTIASLQRALSSGIFGQELFEMAQSKGRLTDSAYQTALATLSRAPPHLSI
jgi:hypothetical protein